MSKYATALLLSLAALSVVTLSGCVVTEATYIREDRPRYYAPPAEEVVVVHRAVPPTYVETVPVAPGPDFVWIRGYYAARGDGWVWVAGHYERPPRAGMVWVQPRYENAGGAIRFSGAHWQVTAVVQPQPVVQPRPVVVAQPTVVVQPQPVVIVHQAMPVVRVERVPPSPGRDYVWIKGYYRAQGETWVWVAGHYERPPRPGAVWVEPRYEPHGGEIHFSLGFWR